MDTLCRPEPHPPKVSADKGKSLRIWDYNQSLSALLTICVTISTLGLDACHKAAAPPPATTAQAQQAPQTRQGADSRVRVYAPDYYVQHHGNNNVNPDYQLGGDHR